jgi:hypothetical protein
MADWLLAVQVNNAFVELKNFSGDLGQALNEVHTLPCPNGGCFVVTPVRQFMDTAEYTNHCRGPQRDALPAQLLSPGIRRILMATDTFTGDEVIFSRKRHWFKGISEDRARKVHDKPSDWGEGSGRGGFGNKSIDRYLRNYGNEMASVLLGEVSDE